MSVSYNPKSITDGLLVNLDPGNPKSYSPNVIPNPTDLFAWVVSGQRCTLSRDTIPSPVGNTPLKMVQTGDDPYTNTYSGAVFSMAPAAQGQTWTVSVWVKASQAIQIEGPWISEQNSAGAYIAGGGSPNPTIGTDWQRVSATYTLTNASTAFVAIRLDGTQQNGAGVTVWWDGLQLQQCDTATEFNPSRNQNNTTMWNYVNSAYNSTLSGMIATRSLSNGNTYLLMDGVDDVLTIPNTTWPMASSDSCTVECWIRIPAAATWANAYRGNILTRGAYAGSFGLARYVTDNQVQFYVRGLTSGLNEASTSITRDTWYHIVGTWDGYYIRIYKNGYLQQVIGQAIVGGFSSTDWNIGLAVGLSGAAGNKFQGDVGLARIYQRELQPNEVIQNYNATRGRFGL